MTKYNHFIILGPYEKGIGRSHYCAEKGWINKNDKDTATVYNAQDAQNIKLPENTSFILWFNSGVDKWHMMNTLAFQTQLQYFL